MKNILPLIGVAASLVGADAQAATHTTDAMPAASVAAKVEVPVMSTDFVRALGDFARQAEQSTRVAQTWTSNGGPYQKGQPYAKGPSQGHSEGGFVKFTRMMRKHSSALPSELPFELSLAKHDAGSLDVRAVYQLHKPA
jgi:hypothetical protein